MKTIKFAALAMGLAFAGSANAAITFAAFDPFQVNHPGEATITEFESSGPNLADVIFLAAGYSLTGTGVLFTGTTGNSAAPAFSSVFDDPTQYLSVQGGQSVLLTTPGIRSFSLYSGSIDGYNKIKFFYADATTESVDGAWVADNTLAESNGNQNNGATNGRLHFQFDKSVVGVQLSSDTNAFEISDFATGVPEPATWGLMILGFGGAGAALRRRRTMALTA